MEEEGREARKLTPAAQIEIRRQAVKLSKFKQTFAATLEVDRNTVSKWIKTYQKEA